MTEKPELRIPFGIPPRSGETNARKPGLFGCKNETLRRFKINGEEEGLPPPGKIVNFTGRFFSGENGYGDRLCQWIVTG